VDFATTVGNLVAFTATSGSEYFVKTMEEKKDKTKC
jgi:hypothetical protein